VRDAVVDWAERALLLLLFVLFAASNLRSEDWINWAFIVMEALTAWFVLTRRRAVSISEHPVDWAVALGGTLLPLLARPGGEAGATWTASVLVIAGTAVAVFAKLSLNRRFGIAPANRGVQTTLAYAVVRHPMYAGYVVAQVGYLLHNPDLRNLLLYLGCWSFQLARITLEERHLMKDPDYRSYADGVRFRLLPGVY
jgi:protein-S-isoprenylcysteine O-methyltransferase Ste14